MSSWSAHFLLTVFVSFGQFHSCLFYHHLCLLLLSSLEIKPFLFALKRVTDSSTAQPLSGYWSPLQPLYKIALLKLNNITLDVPWSLETEKSHICDPGPQKNPCIGFPVGFPVAQLVEHGASNAKIMGLIPRESKS